MTIGACCEQRCLLVEVVSERKEKSVTEDDRTICERGLRGRQQIGGVVLDVNKSSKEVERGLANVLDGRKDGKQSTR